MQFPESEFWNFSINFYQLPEVEETCLFLQDQYQLNVNLILFCHWLSTEKHQTLSNPQWQELIDASIPWDETITMLRQSRRLIGDSTIAWPVDFKQKINDDVGNVELNTEHMQQLTIEQVWLKMNTSSSHMSLEKTIKYNINLYLTASNSSLTLEQIKTELKNLFNACQQYQANANTIKA